MLLKASLHKDLSSITLIKGYIRITLITHSSERESLPVPPRVWSQKPVSRSSKDSETIKEKTVRSADALQSLHKITSVKGELRNPLNSACLKHGHCNYQWAFGAWFSQHVTHVKTMREKHRQNSYRKVRNKT